MNKDIFYYIMMYYNNGYYGSTLYNYMVNK